MWVLRPSPTETGLILVSGTEAVTERVEKGLLQSHRVKVTGLRAIPTWCIVKEK